VEKNHIERLGAPMSVYGSRILYHFMIGKDGTIKQNRSLSERTGHTRNQRINLRSIAIVVNGDFSHERPTGKQLQSLKALITQLDEQFHFQKIMPHREASPTSCPGKNLEEALKDVWREADLGEPYQISRYYSPVNGQLRYLHGSYLKDVEINCGLTKDGKPSDCTHTANGYLLKAEDAYKVAACPPEMPFGTKLEIDGIGVVTCVDRGGAIKQKRIDVWAGYGEDGLRMIYSRSGGWYSVKVAKSSP
jgi:3D (Asp-Asp-Asp) domain-containing protein